MGWFGNGKYDGDGTASVQISMIERAGYKENIPLKNGKVLAESSDWYVGRETLADEVVIKVFNKWNTIEKNEIKSSYEEDNAINYMMAADFFINHKAFLPEGLKDKALEAVDVLLGEHSSEFNEPSARRNVLKNFKEKLIDYPEFSIFKNDTQPRKKI